MSEYHWLPFPSPSLGPGSDPRQQRALSEFLAGPENRLAETAASLAIGGVPFPVNTPSSSDPSVTKPLPQYTPPAGKQSGKRMTSRKINRKFDWLLQPPPYPDGSSPVIVDYMPIKNVPGLSPIVFYGPSGCGKTQLAGGICREIRERDPRAEGIFLNAGEFYRSLTEAIEENRVDELRNLFTQCRVVVLDNLEELENHPVGTNELVGLLRAAEVSGTLIIVTLSHHPDETRSLPAPLRARLVGGLLVPVSFPEKKSRALLLQRIADAFQMKLPPQIEEFILTEFPLPPGEFYGLFSQLYQLHEWDKTVPDPEKIRDFMKKRTLRSPLSLDLIAKITARVFTVKVSDLKSKSRSRTVVSARNMTLYIARNRMEITLQELGAYFAGRDHSTILHGIRTISEKITNDEQVRHQHDIIIRELSKLSKISKKQKN